MRVLALYDIHGNVDALDAVLADPLATDLTSCSSAAMPFPVRSPARRSPAWRR